jgi:hypothetical protein
MKFVDPNDPTKTVSRSDLINFRPRGPTITPGKQKSTPSCEKLTVAKSDAVGKMVHSDVETDIYGIPERLPDLYYLRVPLLKVKSGSFKDCIHRKLHPLSLLQASESEIEELRLEVDRFQWERDLRDQPGVAKEEFEINHKIVEMLKGVVPEVSSHSRIKGQGGESEYLSQSA